MKAFTYSEYGPPSVLKTAEVKVPKPKDNQVLIKIHACSLNASDYEMLTGKPFYTRMWGLSKPKKQILGSDIAGTVESAGKKVSKFKVGDEVFGDIMEVWGGLAEYVCAPEKMLHKKPAWLSFEEASALPQAANVAYQGILSKGKIKKDMQVLINGAGGGSGTFAVQMAKSTGAIVTAVDSLEKFDTMKKAGADYTVDYKTEDFTKNQKKYDIILDLIAAHSFFDYKKSLAPKGKYLLVGGNLSYIFSTLFLGAIFSLLTSVNMRILGVITNKYLGKILQLIEAKQLKIFIDHVYSLEDLPLAMEKLGAGKARGKIVIKNL